MRIYLGAFGDAGHAFPMLALGEALVARGHTVALQTWRNWEEHAIAAAAWRSPRRPSTRCSPRASSR